MDNASNLCVQRTYGWPQVGHNCDDMSNVKRDSHFSSPSDNDPGFLVTKPTRDQLKITDAHDFGINLRHLSLDSESVFSCETGELEDFFSDPNEDTQDTSHHKAGDEPVNDASSLKANTEPLKAESDFAPDESTHIVSFKQDYELSRNNSNFSIIPPIAASIDSVVWLAKRIGPVMTGTYLVQPLLAALILCYEGESLLCVTDSSALSLPMAIQANNRPLVGDSSASACLRSLEQLVHIYGVAYVLALYIPFVRDSISAALASNLSSDTATTTISTSTAVSLSNDVNSEDNSMENDDQQRLPTKSSSRTDYSLQWNQRSLARVVASLTFLHQIVSYLPDSYLVEQLQESVIQGILVNAVRIAGRHDTAFPCGTTGRRAILHKFIDAVYVIGLRVGFELTRTFLTSVFQVFFALFDRVSAEHNFPGVVTTNRETSTCKSDSITQPSTFTESSMKIEYSSQEVKDRSTYVSTYSHMHTELRNTFDRSLARLAYITFCQLAGGTYIDDCLYNSQRIHKLVFQQVTADDDDDFDIGPSDSVSNLRRMTSGIDSTTSTGLAQSSSNGKGAYVTKANQEAILAASSALYSDGSFHLRGCWPHVLRENVHHTSDQSADPFKYHATQIASFVGHIHKINCIDCINTENCFLTASRDKTVRLWSLTDSYNPFYVDVSNEFTTVSGNKSLKSGQRLTSAGRNTTVECNGNAILTRLVYRGHKKSVTAARYLELYRLVASMDDQLLLWDPCTGQMIRSSSQTDPNGWQNLTALERTAIPYGAILCADQSGFLHLVDPRTVASGALGSLHLSSGSNLASFLLSKDRSRSVGVCEPVIPTSLHSASQYSQNSWDSTYTSSLMSLTRDLNASVGANTTPNPSSVGTIHRLAISENGHDVVCGFTSGILTQMDLRNGQVMHVWRGHSENLLDVQYYKANACFVSASDRNLSSWCLDPKQPPIDSAHLSLFGDSSLPNLLDNNFGSIPGIQTISCFTQFKTELLVCGNPTAIPSNMSNPAAVVLAAVNSFTTGSNDNLFSVGTMSNTNSSDCSSFKQSPLTTQSGTILGAYHKRMYRQLGRIPPILLRGSVAAICALPESGLLLVGSDIGNLSVIF